MAKRKPHEQTYTKRQFLAIAGAAAASGLAALLWPTYSPPSWLTVETPPQRRNGNLKYIGNPVEVPALDKRVINLFAEQIVKDEKIKERWYGIGGSTEININVEKRRTEQTCFTPEKRREVAEEYKEYVNYVFNQIFRSFGRQSEIPSVFVPQTSFEERPQTAAIVRDILKSYEADFTLKDRNDEKKSITLQRARMDIEDETYGSDNFGLNMVWEKSITFEQSPILLTIKGPAYVRMQTPVAEALHRMVRPATQALLNNYLTNPSWPKDIEELSKIIQACEQVEEGVVHATANVLTPRIAEGYGLPFDEIGRAAKSAQEKSTPKYRLVTPAERFIDKENPLNVAREYIENPDKIRKKIGATIR